MKRLEIGLLIIWAVLFFGCSEFLNKSIPAIKAEPYFEITQKIDDVDEDSRVKIVTYVWSRNVPDEDILYSSRKYVDLQEIECELISEQNKAQRVMAPLCRRLNIKIPSKDLRSLL